MLKPFLRCTFFFAVALVMAGAAFGQDWFRISTGLGVEKPRVAVAERNEDPHERRVQPAAAVEVAHQGGEGRIQGWAETVFHRREVAAVRVPARGPAAVVHADQRHACAAPSAAAPAPGRSDQSRRGRDGVSLELNNQNKEQSTENRL